MMTNINLESTARALVTSGKGVLAADESLPTIEKRFKTLGIESTEETRRAYRELLFTTGGIERFISGVIMFEETLRQKTAGGNRFVEVLARRNIIPGVKVDKGTIGMPDSPREKITSGRDGLRERLQDYARLGARFSKWRAVIAVGASIPTRGCMYVNAHDLALFAAFSQEAGLVPIVEPEVLMDGDHDITRCEDITSAMLEIVFDAIRSHRVKLDSMLLKPNMILPGNQSARQASPSEVADRTIRTLRRTVPAAVAGILFLSGGQTPEQATEHLNIMNARGPHPWELSFSFGRALQEPALKAWSGSGANIPAAQYLLYQRAKCNGNARFGTYSKQMEKLAA